MQNRNFWLGIAITVVSAVVIFIIIASVVFGFIYYLDHKGVIIEKGTTYVDPSGKVIERDSNVSNKEFQLAENKENHDFLFKMKSLDKQSTTHSLSPSHSITKFVFGGFQPQNPQPQVQQDNSWQDPLKKTNQRIDETNAKVVDGLVQVNGRIDQTNDKMDRNHNEVMNELKRKNPDDTPPQVPEKEPDRSTGQLK